MARRRSRKAGGAGGAIAGGMMIVLALLAMIGVGYLLFLRAEAPQIDGETLCPVDGPVAHLGILVDTTGPLSLTQLQSARQRIEGAIEAAEVGTRISFSTVNPDGEIRSVAFFSMCKPAAGEDANMLYENPRLVQEQFLADFAMPVSEALDNLLRVPEAESSPIMESAQEFAAMIPGFASDDMPRDLLLVSDLMQHSETFSFFRGGDWESFAASGGPSRFGESFNGATVHVLRIPRMSDRAAVIDDFWVRYFDAQGFDEVRVERIGDL